MSIVRIMDTVFSQMDIVMGVIAGIALAASSGFRIFVPLLVVSIAGQRGWIPLSESFAWLGTTTAIIIFAIATAVEISGYMIPFVDHGLDIMAAPVAMIAGTILAMSTMVDMPLTVQIILGLVAGGGAAGVSQAATTLLRLGSTKTTAGLANPLFSKIEAAIALLGSLAAVFIPLLAILFFILLAYVGFKVYKKMSRQVHYTP